MSLNCIGISTTASGKFNIQLQNALSITIANYNKVKTKIRNRTVRNTKVYITSKRNTGGLRKHLDQSTLWNPKTYTICTLKKVTYKHVWTWVRLSVTSFTTREIAYSADRYLPLLVIQLLKTFQLPWRGSKRFFLELKQKTCLSNLSAIEGLSSSIHWFQAVVADHRTAVYVSNQSVENTQF